MKNGFTLVELVLVFGIIAILSTVTVGLLNPEMQFKKSRDTKRKADLAQLQAAFELYRADQGFYPASLPGCSSPFEYSGTVYLKSRPCDPNTSSGNIYSYTTSGSPVSAYTMIACLENINDPQKDTVNLNPPCGRGYRSYTITNP